jgi:glycosyltransferase involved in cell wall biosynthesis
MENKRISIVIPCFNEGDIIGAVLARIPTHPNINEIIVVDDGSTDNTVSEIKKINKNIKIISHKYNIGNGAAIKTGAKNASGDWLLLMDADGQHQPEDILKLINFIDDYDMVVGARGKNAKISKSRSLGNMIFNSLATYLTKIKIADLTSGFRLVNREKFMEFYDLYPNQYSYPTTSTIAFIKSGYFIKYVEMDTIAKRKSGKSKIRPLEDGMRFINIILKVIIFFSPMRFFLPVFIFFFSIAVLVALYQMGFNHKLSGTSIILFLFSFQIFFIGLVIDQISYLIKKNK